MTIVEASRSCAFCEREAHIHTLLLFAPHKVLLECARHFAAALDDRSRRFVIAKSLVEGCEVWVRAQHLRLDQYKSVERREEFALADADAGFGEAAGGDRRRGRAARAQRVQVP